MPEKRLTLKTLEDRIKQQGKIIAELIDALQGQHPVIGGTKRTKWSKYKKELKEE